MNRVLTIAGILIVALIVGFLVGGFLGPQGFKMQRSVVMHAPRAVIYRNISNYRNWIRWSPWATIDSACKYEYYGDQGQVGAGYRWTGNNKVGEGDMHTTGMDQDSDLLCKLTFVKPMRSEAMAEFTLTDTAGDIKVTWGFSQSYTFGQRPMMLFFNMEKMLAPDYEHGLANLKALSESQAAHMPAIQVREVDWAAHTYLADRATIDMKDLSKVFMDKMPRAFGYIQENKLQMDGPPSGLYFTWDMAAGKTDMAIAIPVKGVSKIAGGYSIITIAAGNALMVDYYGSYDKMKPAHDAIQKYAVDNGLKLKSPAIEEYIGDPGREKDPDKVLTKIYYLVAE
jgi:effector-binding domain-containing protein